MVAEPKWINLLHGTKCWSLRLILVGTAHWGESKPQRTQCFLHSAFALKTQLTRKHSALNTLKLECIELHWALNAQLNERIECSMQLNAAQWQHWMLMCPSQRALCIVLNCSNRLQEAFWWTLCTLQRHIYTSYFTFLACFPPFRALCWQSSWGRWQACGR